DRQRFIIEAGVHTIGGYSAHADQKDLLAFIRRMRFKPADIRLVHGDERAKNMLKEMMRLEMPEADISIP
ncbi:MAG: MBL fold metallo-hydrolase, partial [Gammaproteobacteria bacterium]|nr:MBL fold metallo-hydrolase [Gammaproteobacteria bacterium]